MDQERGDSSPAETPESQAVGELHLEQYGYRHWSLDRSEEKPSMASPHYREEHEAETPRGSFVVGVKHGYEKPETKRRIDEYVVPELTRRARQALADEKMVTFVAEGAVGGVAGSEQEVVARALDQATNGAVRHDTWDDEAVIWHEPFPETIPQDATGPTVRRTSPAFKKMAERFEEPDIVDAGLYVMMAGLGSHARLSSGARRALDRLGVDPTDRLRMYDIAFGDGATDRTRVLRKITEMYNRLRQENMLRKIRAVEKAGGVALVIAGASHAFALKHVLEQFERVSFPDA